jgi:FtsZ-binding cell division protein ZapB
MTRRLIAITSVALAAFTPVIWGQSQLEETREVFQKLVDARQDIANQQSLWRVQKQSLMDTIKLLQLEIDLLDKRIAETESASTQAEKDRIQLNAKIEELKEASAVVATVIRDFEVRMLKLVNALPSEIKGNLERLTNRIPDRNTPANRIRASLGERLQNIVGLLDQMEVFNNGIHVLNEVRNIGGQNISLKVLYIGLSGAYYVNTDQGVAGYGKVNAESGWTWTDDVTLVESVDRAIQVYESKIPAEFVQLPVH